MGLTLPVDAALIADPLYTLGFTDAEHTRDDGYQHSTAQQQNEAGQVIGVSTRYNGASYAGNSVWQAGGGTNTRLGFTDAEHTRDDGYRNSQGVEQNEAGQVIGNSYRYSGANDAGRSAWQATGGTNTRLGYFGVGYTRSDGFQYSEADQQNEAGQVMGYSLAYSGSNYLGSVAWQASGGILTNLGLTDAEHTIDTAYGPYRENMATQQNEAGQVIGYATRNYDVYGGGQSVWQASGGTTAHLGFTDANHTSSDGEQYSEAQQQNEAGQVIGYSNRYSGASDAGRSAWQATGGTATRLGFTDAEHTRNDGYQFSVTEQQNQAGLVVGDSSRYNGASDAGNTLWQASGGTNTRLGFTDAEHTRDDGYQYSSFQGLNEAGQVVGSSARYNGAASAGNTIWQASGGTTTRLGLTDAEHTRDDGYQASSATRQNEAGQVIGLSVRYNGASDAGRSAWQASGGTTTRLGLIDATHTRDDGYQRSTAQRQNEVGQVVGSSERYNGAAAAGQTAWFFDYDLGSIFAFDLSARSDGYSLSSWGFLGENGLGLGSYTRFDALDNDLGARAFGFTVADGFFDLGELVVDGLDSAGWVSLATAAEANGLDQVIGWGYLNNSAASQMPYQLTLSEAPTAEDPVPTPAPPAWILLFTGLLGLDALRIRRDG